MVLYTERTAISGIGLYPEQPAGERTPDKTGIAPFRRSAGRTEQNYRRPADRERQLSGRHRHREVSSQTSRR